MKRSLFTFLALLAFSFVNAQEANPDFKNKNNSHYCFKAKGDVQVLMLGDTEITEDVKLKNGDRLTVNGRIMRLDGTEIKLKEGDCVSINGDAIKAKRK
ncbi:MAG: hypothetical protein Q8L81_10830 [Bacteroidota bacterium]|nr:hypothetical protein [Bacteroidota bacterium]